MNWNARIFLIVAVVVLIMGPALCGRGAPLDQKTLSEWKKLGNLSGRNLKRYYKLRAYIGAPPVIPHSVESQTATGRLCLTCHAKGGYVPKYKAYAPITPHPQFLNCQQCHVAQNTEKLFRPTDWKTVSPPKLGRSALPDSPPSIPHGLQMRENCLACHAGPAAVFEIRTPHPGRTNCLQCHVTHQKGETLQLRAESVDGTRSDQARPSHDLIQQFPCHQCHDEHMKEIKIGKGPAKRSHWDISLDHGPEGVLECRTCHSYKNMDSLRLLDGKRVSFDAWRRVCAQCHLDEVEDWKDPINPHTPSRGVGVSEEQ